jgi:hypothetical protein
MITTGVSGSMPLMPLSSWIPFIRGIWMSVITTSNGCFSIKLSALAPELTVSTS